MESGEAGKRSTNSAGRRKEAEQREREGHALHLLGCVWLCACRRQSGCSGWVLRSPPAEAAGAGCGFLVRGPEELGFPVAAEAVRQGFVLVGPVHLE